MFDSKFNIQQQILLSVGLLFIAFSVFQFCFLKNKALPLLLIGTFFLSLFAITLDPFLNSWDEQYHALVGKNMSVTPLHPKLYPNPALPYSHEQWTLNYTWVHKQPWFMWQMALLIKFFGASEIIIRIPSLICFLFATYSVYKIGKNLCNENIGYLSALLWSSNYFFYALMSGGRFTDQNDIVFICYTTISIWAFTEYVIANKKTKWIILIGVFAGISVLTKWLSGLIVFSAFGTYTLLENWPNIHKPKNYKNLIFSFLICIIIAGAWQIYILNKFPIEAKFEFSMISKHFNEVVEGHGGTNWFYLESFPEVYGKLSILFLAFGIYALNKFTANKNLFFSSVTLVFLTYVFFTIAKTKMVAFPLICSSLIITSFASGLYMFIGFINRNKFAKWINLTLLLSISILLFRVEEIQYTHTLWHENGAISGYRSNKIFLTKIYKHIKAPDKKAVLFNCPYDGYIEAMFYSDFASAYFGLPNSNQIEIAKKKGFKICVLDDGNLSVEVRSNKNLNIVTSPQFHIIKTDTISILNEDKMALTLGEKKEFHFICTSTPQKYIIDYFEDSSCRIRLLSGEYLSFNVPGEGLIYAGTTNFTYENRFNVEKEDGGFFSLKTPFETPIKIDKSHYLVYGENKAFKYLKIKIVS